MLFSFRALLYISCAVLLVLLAGCKVSDEGNPNANSAPTTSLTVAPNDGATVNHYIPLRWAGNDRDGEVAGFMLMIDGVQIAFTAARDTNIAFRATTDGTVTQHSFSVQAVDIEGLVDPNPPVRNFGVINFAPRVSFNNSETIAADTTGKGFRVTLSAQDSNLSIIYYSLSLDDTLHWTPWSLDSTYLYVDPSLTVPPASSLLPEHANYIPNTSLTDGQHTIYARVKDAGDALSANIPSRTFTVLSNYRPRMQNTVTAQYGTATFYADGSVYYTPNTETKMSFSASASVYQGEIYAYRYQRADSAWSSWIKSPEITYANLPAGDHDFKLIAQDIAGAYSDTLLYVIRLVEQALTDSIIIIDETRDGNGNRGSPSDAQVDAFYEMLFSATNHRQIDYATRPAGVANIITPYDLKNSGVVMWHADDRSDRKLGDNTRILREYLNKGGRLILSGWDLMASFATDASLDSIGFDANSFAREQLRAFYANRTSGSSRVTMGFYGAPGYPSCTIDTAKAAGTSNRNLDKCWTFHQRGECQVLGTLMVSDSTSNPLWQRPTAYYYYLSFRVAVFGVPLYFVHDDEAHAFFDILIPQMLEGLTP